MISKTENVLKDFEYFEKSFYETTNCSRSAPTTIPVNIDTTIGQLTTFLSTNNALSNVNSSLNDLCSKTDIAIDVLNTNIKTVAKKVDSIIDALDSLSITGCSVNYQGVSLINPLGGAGVINTTIDKIIAALKSSSITGCDITSATIMPLGALNHAF